MGLACNIYLPLSVDADDVADAVGILLGLPKKMASLRDGGGSGFNDAKAVEVDGVEVRGKHSVGMAYLTFKAPKGKKLINGMISLGVDFFVASREGAKFWNTVSPSSTPLWCAVGKRLVEFFGGYVVYNDCAEGRKNRYRRKGTSPKDRYGHHPDNDRGWAKFQKALFALESLTPKEVRAMKRVAGYVDCFENDGMTHKESA